jgi:hypothetical protein
MRSNGSRTAGASRDAAAPHFICDPNHRLLESTLDKGNVVAFRLPASRVDF